MMNARIRLLSSVALVGLVAHSRADLKDISFIAEPLFKGKQVMEGRQPMAYILQNSGEGTNASISISSPEGLPITIPVSLPKGAEKTILGEGAAGYQQQTVLTTDFGRIELPENNNVAYGNRAILQIGGRQDDLGFLASQGDLAFIDLYADPKLLPTRSTDYDRIQTIVLAEGAELMNDQAASALLRAVMGGRHLLILGGASAPILSDKRFAPLVVSGQVRPVAVAGIRSKGTFAASGPITISAGTFLGKPLWSDGSNTILSHNSFGLGTIYVLAFDITDGPGRTYPGRGTIIRATLLPTPSQERNYYGPERPQGVMLTAESILGGISSNQGMFQVSPPSMRNVALTLGAYLLIVLPLNFWILGKLKRPQLAWLTIPIVSAAFSGVVFSFAAGLYKQDLQTATSAFIVGDARSNSILVAGRQQVFVPQGGNIPLKIEGLEDLRTARDESDYYSFSGRSRDEGQTVSLVDTGNLIATANARNLSFHDNEFVQTLTTGPLINASLKRVGDRWRGTLQNTSNYTLSSVRLRADDNPSSDANIPTLAPGQSASISGKVTPETLTAGFLVLADVDGAFGAQVGRKLSQRVQLAYRIQGDRN